MNDPIFVLAGIIILICTYKLFGFGIEICFDAQQKSAVFGLHTLADFPVLCVYTHHLTVGIVILGIGIGLGFQWK